MIKRIAAFLFICSFIIMIVSVALLMNFTALNPTGRRYSSEAPLTTGQGNAGEIGLSGEKILANDLGLPRNDQPDQLQCICNNPTQSFEASECRVCIAYSPMISTYRRPDFIGQNFIAESKNSQNLLYTGREVDQIRDYAAAALALDKPLWIFTRVNTNVAPEFEELAEATGGGVVQYFTVPGWVDTVDQTAKILLVVAIVVIVLMMMIFFYLSQDNQPKQRTSKYDPLEQAEEYLKRAKDKAHLN